MFAGALVLLLRSSERFVEGARCPLHGSPNVAVRRDGLDMEERG